MLRLAGQCIIFLFNSPQKTPFNTWWRLMIFHEAISCTGVLLKGVSTKNKVGDLHPWIHKIRPSPGGRFGNAA